jgi:hypothetical protein
MAHDQDIKMGLQQLLSGQTNTEELFKQVYGGSGATTPRSQAAPPSAPKSASAPPKAAPAKKKKKGGFLGFFGGKEEEEAPETTVISGPTGFKREMHIGFNPETGAFEVRLLFS